MQWETWEDLAVMVLGCLAWLGSAWLGFFVFVASRRGSLRSSASGFVTIRGMLDDLTKMSDMRHGIHWI